MGTPAAGVGGVLLAAGGLGGSAGCPSARDEGGDGVSAVSVPAKRGHRAHASVVRSRRKEALFTPTELAVIELASAQAGLRAGAFIAAAAVGAAKAYTADRDGAAVRTSDELRQVADEIRELRRLLGNVAGNLNDVARHANSTGRLGENADAVLAFARRTNERIDTWLMEYLRGLR